MSNHSGIFVLCEELKQCNFLNPDIHSNFDKLIKFYNKFKPIESRYDFKTIEHNGLRSFCKILEAFLAKIATDIQYDANNIAYNEFLLNITQVFVLTAEMVENFLLPKKAAEKLSYSQTALKMVSPTESQCKAVVELDYHWISTGTRFKFWLLGITCFLFQSFSLNYSLSLKVTCMRTVLAHILR